MVRIVAVLFAAVVSWAGGTASAAAQGAAPQSAAAPPAGTAPAFVVQSDNGDNRLQLGAIVHADARFAIDDDQRNVLDTFQVRRFRAVAQGRVARYFDFFLNTDFAGGAVNVRDAYVDTLFSPAFRVRLGKFKAPFSYDRNILVVNTLFVERGLTASVAPDRDSGVQLFGDLWGTRLSYAASLTNGVIDGGSSDIDGNEGKDVTARLVARPVSGLGVAFAVNTGTQGTALPSFLTSGRQTFFSYAGAAGEGRRTRWSPQAFYYRGPFGGYAEYVTSRGGVAKAGVTGDIDHEAWQVAGSWVLTGEVAPPERNVRPRASFDPPSGHFGALQLVARVQKLAVSRDAFARGLVAPIASRTADVWAVGLNWYLNPFIKWQINVERSVFDGDPDGLRHPETMLLGRAQLAF
jgi:phosphate-selective porin OprO/OprP